MEVVDKIKETYKQLDRKGDFSKVVAKRFGITALTVKAHWMSVGSIPEQHQEEVLSMAQRSLRIQKEYLKKLQS